MTTLEELVAFALEAEAKGFEAEARAYEAEAKQHKKKAEAYEAEGTERGLRLSRLLWKQVASDYEVSFACRKLAKRLQDYALRPAPAWPSQAENRASESWKQVLAAKEKGEQDKPLNLRALWGRLVLLRQAQAHLWQAVSLEYDRAQAEAEGTPDANAEGGE